jgi:hypothetical protein
VGRMASGYLGLDRQTAASTGRELTRRGVEPCWRVRGSPRHPSLIPVTRPLS